MNRWLIRRDIPAMLDIERASFAHPWTEEELLARLRQRNCIGLVHEAEGKILGFVIYELHKQYLEITDIAVAPEARRQRVASSIVSRLVNKLISSDRSALHTHVRDGNLAAHLFLRSQGFLAMKIYPAGSVYDDEDAYLFVLHADAPVTRFAPVNRLSGHRAA